MGVATEDSGFSFPKNLSVWWSEETEYVLQRIERWAAYARGYNRLRSVRLSPGRMTMHDEPDQSRWRISQTTNRLVAESNSWSPSFRHQRQKRQPEQTRLSCCALSNLGNYKSNANLDSNCLEAYSLDHSIYFKTIGEIRSEIRPESKGNANNNNNNDNRAAATGAENGNSGDVASQPRTTPLDCGDFLSSDFDELDDDEELGAELDDVDYDLRQQLDQLELQCTLYTSGEDDEQGRNCATAPDVIQVCRSVINEDEINNNVMLMGLQRKFCVPATAAAQ